MNASKLHISILLLTCILLSACVPAVATTVVTSTMSSTPISPTDVPVTGTPTSDPDALAQVTGKYMYKTVSSTYHILLRPDGTYATLAGFGTYVVTQEQITFVDNLPASGTQCGYEAGIYRWTVDNNKLNFVPIEDKCDQRAFVLGNNTFEKVQDDTNAPVDFVWRINGAPNTFGRPWPITVDAHSNLYVIDGANQRIQKFDSNGNFLGVWGSYGDSDGQFIFHYNGGHFGSVAVDQAGNIYVTDYTQRIQKLDNSGGFLLKWGTLGNGPGEFGDTALGSLEVGVDNQDSVYVLDPTNHRVEKFDDNGKFLMQWGSQGSGDGQFGDDTNGPGHLVVDNHNNIYVSDEIHYRIEKFDSNGRFLNSVPYSKGTGDGQVLNLAGFAVDQQGNIYIADNQQNVGGSTNQFSKFDFTGKFLWKWGNTGGDLGQFFYTNGIAVDKQGNIYVASEDIVQKFKPK